MDVERQCEPRRKAERRKEESESLTERIAELKAKKATAVAARQMLDKFVVESASFAMEERRFGGPAPAIKMTVRNDTGRAVSRAYFAAKVTTPGREVPWVEEPFNYEIKGGVESGESQTWELAPNQFGPWGRAPREGVLILTARPTQLDGADGKPFAEDDWDAADDEKLAELEKSLAELKAAG